jgi:hypothetical protein
MLLFIAFEFVMNVLLLNVLIASMTNSFSKITQVREQLSLSLPLAPGLGYHSWLSGAYSVN